MLLQRAALQLRNARLVLQGTSGLYKFHSEAEASNIPVEDQYEGFDERDLALVESNMSEDEHDEESRYRAPDNSAIESVISELSKYNPNQRRLERLLSLRRGTTGKFENLMEIVADRSILVAAYQRIKARPGLWFPDIGSVVLPLDWFTRTQQALMEGSYEFENYKRTQNIRRYGLRATQHRLKDRYTLLMVHLWAMRTKRCEILTAKCEFYGGSTDSLRNFTLDFFLNFNLDTKFKVRKKWPEPPVGDLIVQEAMHMALERIYEPMLLPSVHGYRPQKGCHTMFRDIQHWLGCTWLMEFDIGKFWEKLDAGVLAEVLGEQIEDPKFVDLVMRLCRIRATVTVDERLSARNEKRLKLTKTVRPDYEEYGVKNTVLGPLLCHIYLQKLDAEMLNIQEEQEANPLARRNRTIFTYGKKKEDLKAPPIMVRYARYMDEFVVGVSGSLYVVEKVQDLILGFLDTALRIEPDYASYADISLASTMFLGMRLTAAKSTFDPVVESKKLEKRKRSKFRFKKLVAVRVRCWEEQIQKLTTRAWMKGLRKTRGRLKSLSAAQDLLDRKSERMCEDFAVAKLESGETRLAVEELLNCESAVFYNMAAIGIPEEIYRAQVHLKELLEKHLERISKEDPDEKPIRRPRTPSWRREMILTYDAFPIRLFAPTELITADLKLKGLIRAQDRACSVSSLINAPDESIVSYFSALAYALLGYYRCCDNYIKVKRMVDYQVRWGAILTLACRHDFSPRKTIVEYKRGPQMLTVTGDVLASLPSTPIISRMGLKYYEEIQETSLQGVMKYMDK